MTDFLEILVNEHKHILKLIDKLLGKCELMEKEDEIDKEFFIKCVEFIKGYADGFHHLKEEDILFVELSGKGVQMRCNPVEQMLYEHDLGRSFIKGLEKGIKEKNKNKIIENAKEYAQLLQEHIYKENNILYPMAEEALSAELKDKILAKFIEVEQKFNKEVQKHLLFLNQISS